jgi:hypothetical protein
MRREADLDDEVVAVTIGPSAESPCLEGTIGNPYGSSTLYGVMLAMKLGYQKVIVAGSPLLGRQRVPWPDEEPNHQNTLSVHPYGYAAYRGGWLSEQPVIMDRVRSVSGWTMELLGEPTVEWLEE